MLHPWYTASGVGTTSPLSPLEAKSDIFFHPPPRLRQCLFQAFFVSVHVPSSHISLNLSVGMGWDERRRLFLPPPREKRESHVDGKRTRKYISSYHISPSEMGAFLPRISGTLFYPLCTTVLQTMLLGDVLTEYHLNYYVLSPSTDRLVWILVPGYQTHNFSFSSFLKYTVVGRPIWSTAL